MGTSRKSKRKQKLIADLVDPYELYEASVQNVAEECSVIDFLFRQLSGRKAQSLREDFCGTASAACEWVRLGKSRYAFGVDLDPKALAWGRKHRVRELKKRQRQRVSLLRGNVLNTETPKVDVTCAFNFSYWVFQERSELLRYFRVVHDNLNPDGIFFLDAYGGSGAFTEVQEPTEMDGFTYIWDQASYSPVTGQMKTHIHFAFPDGSRLDKAFSYEWRLWTLPEIRELLDEAGFRSSTVWFEYKDENGDGLGEWYSDEFGEADPAWIANITAEK